MEGCRKLRKLNPTRITMMEITTMMILKSQLTSKNERIHKIYRIRARGNKNYQISTAVNKKNKIT
jgi:hypothetical protein